MASRKTQEKLSRKPAPAAEQGQVIVEEVVGERWPAPHREVTAELAAIGEKLEHLVAGLALLTTAVREVGLALVAKGPPAITVAHEVERQPRKVPSSVASLPPSPAPGLAGQTRTEPAPTPPLPASLEKVHAEAKPPPGGVPGATLQQAQQAVLKHSAANGSAATAAILQKLGVDRVSNVKGDDAPAKYAAIVRALS